MAKIGHLKNKDVEFAVDHRGKEHIFDTFNEACGFAVQIGVSEGMDAFVDVLIFSEKGAGWWGGDDAQEQYRDDPEASVFQRIKIRASDQGKVP